MLDSLYRSKELSSLFYAECTPRSQRLKPLQQCRISAVLALAQSEWDLLTQLSQLATQFVSPFFSARSLNCPLLSTFGQAPSI